MDKDTTSTDESQDKSQKLFAAINQLADANTTTNESLNPVYTEPQKKGKVILRGDESIEELISIFEVREDEEAEQEHICMELVSNNTTTTFGTLGNFSLIIGKAKSRKTFFHSILQGAWINNGTSTCQTFNGIFKATPPEGQPLCLYFDTEQSRPHVIKVRKRVLSLTGGNGNTNFKVYNLRTIGHKKREEFIRNVIYSTPGVGLVVIDGIRDLVSDINSADEATETAGKLLKWSEELNLHIVTILHQNKGDNNARGHLGAELVNKAETTISVTKEGDLSVVSPEYCRDKDFIPFAFTVDEIGMPVPAEYTPPQKEKAKKASPNSLSDDVKRQILIDAFKVDYKQKRAMLLTNLNLAFERAGHPIGETKTKAFLLSFENSKLISKEGKAPHSYFTLNIPG